MYYTSVLDFLKCGLRNPLEASSVFLILGFCVCRLVSGAGDIKLTKDGNVLLHEMVRKHINVKGLSY